jgi:hypothetical protein
VSKTARPPTEAASSFAGEAFREPVETAATDVRKEKPAEVAASIAGSQRASVRNDTTPPIQGRRTVADVPTQRPTTQRPRLRGTCGGNARVVSRNRVYFQIIHVKEASCDRRRRTGSRHCRIARSHPSANQRRRSSGLDRRRAQEIASLRALRIQLMSSAPRDRPAEQAIAEERGGAPSAA